MKNYIAVNKIFDLKESNIELYMYFKKWKNEDKFYEK